MEDIKRSIIHKANISTYCILNINSGASPAVPPRTHTMKLKSTDRHYEYYLIVQLFGGHDAIKALNR